LQDLQFLESPERGVLLMDVNYVIRCANPRAAEIFNTKLDQLIGFTLPDWIKTRPQNPKDTIEEVLYPDYKVGMVLHRYSGPVYGASGEITGRIELYSDITARRRLETEILERNRQLAELNKRLQKAQEELLRSERLRTLGEMAAGIAHDINNALGIVLGNVQLAKRLLKDNPGVSKCIDSIELAARDAAETVRKLKEIGKPVDRSHYRPLDLSKLAESVATAAIPTWQESGKQIELITEFEPDCTVNGDEAELREALTNILFNAVQAIKEHGTIKVATKCNGNEVLLTVADNGIGMNDEIKKRVFDPFFTTRGSAGTGLGMSMVAAIAMRPEGKVAIESEEGKGTVVVLRLPKAE